MCRRELVSRRRAIRCAMLVSAPAISTIVALACSADVTSASRRAAHAFEITARRTPRFLTAGREATIPLRLANTGNEPWVPERRFNLSYHWWTALGREVEHDGVRTELPRTIAPLESAEIEGRLRAPNRPGLYLLEWDIVQEEVAWLSERGPGRGWRTLVIVLPPWTALALPLPSLVAALGWVMVRRARRPGHGHRAADSGPPAATGSRLPAAADSGPAAAGIGVPLSIADTVWCATSLLNQQLFLVFETGLQLTPAHVLTGALAAVAVPSLFTLAIRSRRRPWVSWAVATSGAAIIAADVLYFRYFNDVLSLPVLLASSQLGHLGGSIMSLIAPRDVWLVLDLVVALPLVAALSRLGITRSKRRAQLKMASACLGATLVGSFALPLYRRTDESDQQQVFRSLARVQALSAFVYHTYDAWEYLRARTLKPPLDERERLDIERWFAERAKRRAGTGPWFGAARGRNLIVIQVESLQQFVVGLRINGREVTPSLNRWRDEGLWFSNVTDQTSEGRTSDCEFLSLASLLPLEHGAVAYRYPTSHYTALPSVLAAQGYDTLSAVAFEANFWNRRVTHPTFGFARSVFGPAFAPGLRIGWGLNDRDFLAQMVPRLSALRQPFAAWLITLSLHHPFVGFPDHLKRLDVGSWENRSFGNYLHAMSFFDRAFGEFLAELDRLGLLSTSVVAVLGDHDAGFAWESSIARTVGFPPHVLDWYLQDRVPLIVRVPGSTRPRGERPLVAGQADVAPTLLALLGADPAPLAYMGRNLLGNSESEPVVRPYGDWIDERHLFVAGGGAPGHATCYDISARSEVSLEECRAGTALAAQATRASRQVLTYDLQERLSHSNGIASSSSRSSSSRSSR